MKFNVSTTLPLCFLLCLSSQCMERMPKSLKTITAQVVREKGLLHKIEIPELKYQTQLLVELDTIKKCCYSDYEILLVLIEHLGDLDKLTEIYNRSLHSIIQIFEKCAAYHCTLLTRLIFDGYMRVCSDEDDATALMKAIIFNDKTKLVELIEKSENSTELINQFYEPFGVLPLIEAARRGYYDIAELLIEHNALIGHKDRASQTALIVAASNGHLAIVELLLEHNATVDAKDATGDTAVLRATEQGHVKVVEYLLKRGAQQQESSCNPLTAATVFGDIELVKLWLSEGVFSKEDVSMPLNTAARMGHTEIIELLICNGADPDLVCSLIEASPLMMACETAKLEAVHLLLAHGVNINQINSYGYSAVLAAAGSGTTEIMKLLIEHGAEYKRVKGKETLLMRAALCGHCEMVKFLIELGVGLEETNYKGDTALMRAALSGSVQGVNALLESGVAINAINSDGETALMIAVHHGCTDVVKLLLKHKAEVDRVNYQNMTALQIACSTYRCEIARLLLEHGVDINHVDKAGNTALIRAVLLGSVDIIRILLEYNADLSIADTAGETAETIALRGGIQPIVNLINAKK